MDTDLLEVSSLSQLQLECLVSVGCVKSESEPLFDVSPRQILPPAPVAEFIQLDAGSGTNQDSMDNYTRLGPPTGPRV